MSIKLQEWSCDTMEPLLGEEDSLLKKQLCSKDDRHFNARG